MILAALAASTAVALAPLPRPIRRRARATAMAGGNGDLSRVESVVDECYRAGSTTVGDRKQLARDESLLLPRSQAISREVGVPLAGDEFTYGELALPFFSELLEVRIMA